MSLPVVPASNGKFSFAVDSSVDSFYVESSGNHLHPPRDHPRNSRSISSRTPRPLKATKISCTTGIPAPKQKAVANMRLFDAVQSGSLTVPGEIAKIERKLKKEWTKKYKDARAGTNPAGDGAAATAG
ncbi:hypothetical protein PHISP_07417 [Aspergillus sp. HF37]|nr:hypothetical protein PHISP_07417 [Aspergillus sp. HF37]